MITKFTGPLLCTAMVMGYHPSNAQYQILVGDSSNVPVAEPVAVLSTSGAAILARTENDTLRIVKFDANGTVEWGRYAFGENSHLPGPNDYGDIYTNGNEGVLLSGVKFSTHSDGEFEENDSIVFRINYAKVDPDGDLTGTFGLTRTFYVSNSALPSLSQAPIHLGSNGERFVLLNYFNFNNTAGAELFKLDEAGGISWARSIGQVVPNSQFPTTNPSPLDFSFWEFRPSPDGSIFLIRGSTSGGPPQHQVVKLASDGTLQWAKSFTYSADSWGSPNSASAVDAQGRLLLTGLIGLQTSAPYSALFETIAPDGTVGSAYLFSHIATGPMFVHPSGDVFVAGRERLYKLDAQGVTPVAYEPLTSFAPPFIYTQQWIPFGFSGNSFYGMGRYHRIHDVTGEELIWGSLLRMDLTMSDDCAWPAMADMQVYPLSPQIIAVQDLSNFQAADIAAGIRVSTAPDISFGEAMVPELRDLCSIATSIPYEGSSSRGFLRTNLLVPGTPLQLTDEAVSRIEVIDMHGKLIASYLTRPQGSVSTDEWSSGIYVIRAMDKDGLTLGTQRIVLQ